eukprot:SAG22_NODE_843_length_6889_cov_61.521649_10_plen_257_part_00
MLPGQWVTQFAGLADGDLSGREVGEQSRKGQHPREDDEETMDAATNVSVFDRLQKFLESEETTLVLSDTTPAERSAAHKFVESHESSWVRGWLHDSKTAGGKRQLVVVKRGDRPGGGTPAAPAATTRAAGGGGGGAAAGGGAKKKKRQRGKKKKDGADPDAGLDPVEAERRALQRAKRLAALALVAAGAEKPPPSKRRRANSAKRKRKNFLPGKKKDADGADGAAGAKQLSGENAGLAGAAPKKPFLVPAEWKKEA